MYSLTPSTYFSYSIIPSALFLYLLIVTSRLPPQTSIILKKSMDMVKNCVFLFYFLFMYCTYMIRNVDTIAYTSVYKIYYHIILFVLVRNASL